MAHGSSLISRRVLLERGAGMAALATLPGHGWIGAMSALVTEGEYVAAAMEAARWIAASAVRDGDGTTWPADPLDPATVQHNLCSGSPGVVVFLCELHRATRDPAILAEAESGARYLWSRLTDAGAGRTAFAGEAAGLTWEISPSVPRRYPNFSHGAAGVSYFLASLYGVTRERAFLNAAVKGARYLQGVASETPGKGRMIFHSEPGNEQLFYLSWCHGPAGTARLFHKLAQVTGEDEWAAYVDKLTTATRDMGIPERQSSGFWNNVSQCCGSCGVAEYYLALHGVTRRTEYIDDAVRVMRHTLGRGTRDGAGLRWVQAEHRVRPELLIAQTGLMQGAAGVGLALLHLDGALSGRSQLVVLPDSPFGAS